MKITSSNIDEIHAKILEQFKLEGDITPIIPNLQETISHLISDHFTEHKGVDGAWESLHVRDGSALEDSGVLAGSVVVEIKKDGLGFSIELMERDYGRYHEYGATIPITPKSRAFFWYKYKETGKVSWKYLAMTKKKFFVLPPRPHLRLTKDDLKEIGATIQELLS